MTTLHSLQTSLDILRETRPDFTPRTGFVWPITDAPSGDSLTKKSSTEEVASHDVRAGELSGSDQITTKKQDPQANARKQQNIIPLLNAMRTTGAHSAASFVTHPSEGVPAETSQELSQSSGTPAPREDTPGFSKSSASQDSSATLVKPSLAGGKKRKKRPCLVYFLLILMLK